MKIENREEKSGIVLAETNLAGRNRAGKVWQVIFQASTIVGILALIALMLHFGLVAASGFIPFLTARRRSAAMSSTVLSSSTSWLCAPRPLVLLSRPWLLWPLRTAGC